MTRVLCKVFCVAMVAACSPPNGDSPIPPDASDPLSSDAGPRTDASPPSDAWVPTTCTQEFTVAGNEAAQQVLLTGSFTQPVAWAANVADGALEMSRSDNAWRASFEFEPGTYVYKFIIDGSWQADSANPESQSDGFGGLNSVYTCAGGGGGGSDGVCGDPNVFDWRDTVMYFAMVDRFFDSDGNAQPVSGATGMDASGNSGQYEGGDLPGMTAKLPYLADLGVTALWLSAPFDNRDTAGAAIDPGDWHTYSGYHGYWPSPGDIDYGNMSSPFPRPRVEPRLGTDDDLHDLIAGAHSLTGANGQGMKILFDYVMNHVDIDSELYQSHPDWFVYDNGQFALCGPDDLWNDPYWGTRCAFTNYLPPLDLYNDTTRQWSVNDAVWWAKEFGIDGYRLDAIKHVPLSWLTDLRSRLNAEFPNPAGDRFYLVGETFDYFNRDLLKQFINPQSMLDGQFDFPFKRELCEGIFNPNGDLSSFSSFMNGNDTFYNTAGGPAVMTTWIGNHDVPRAIHFANWRFQNCTEGSHGGNVWTSDYSQPQASGPYERLAMAFAIMLTNPGIPLIYYGDEVGLAGGGDPDNRRMMPWDDSQLNDHQKTLRSKVRKLARVRGEYKALARGSRSTLHVDQDTWVYRMGCTELDSVIVAINAANEPRSIPLPNGAYVEQMSGNDVDGGVDYQLPTRGFIVLTPR